MTNKKQKNYSLIFILLIVCTLLVFAANIFIGSVSLTPAQTLSAIFSEHAQYSQIIRKIRLPRAAAAMILGGALSLSGYLLQTFFHNPIAGPFVLGVSSGAKLTVSFALIAASALALSINSALLVTAAFVGAMLSLGFVLLISHKTENISMIVVCGIMIGYICSAVTDFLVTFADDSDIADLHDWSQGTFSGMSAEDVLSAAGITFIAVIGTVLISKPMNAFMLGESYAKNLGVNIKLLKAAIVVLSGLFSACVTAFAGPISFVGIAVPHISRRLFGTSKPIVMIPACFLCGSIFCMICDMTARTILSPTELSISTVTSVFGAPIVIMVMLKRRKEGGA